MCIRDSLLVLGINSKSVDKGVVKYFNSLSAERQYELGEEIVTEIERYRSLIEAELKHADKSDLKPSLNNFTTAIRPFKYLYGDYEFYTNLVDVAEGFFIIGDIQSAQNLSIQIANEYSERMELYAQFPISNRAQLKDRIEKEWVAYNYFLQIVNKYDNSEFFKKLENEPYSLNRIEDIVEKIETITINEQFESVQANVTENIVSNKINLNFKIEEMERFFIERINIFGNNVTRESVIRNQIEIDEGDPFNQILYAKSLNNIRALNFFENVDGEIIDLSLIHI